MSLQTKPLGVLNPLGGGDPIPLFKNEFVVGRRRKCDVCLDFENVSGNHCVFRLVNGVWHLRDMASTNGTTLNGLKVTSEHGVLPDDEIGIATHYFRLDYEPVAPTTLLQNIKMLNDEKDIVETRRQKSLMELAGFEEEDRARRPARTAQHHDPIVRPSADEVEFEDQVPDDFGVAKPAQTVGSDSEFLKLFEDEFKGNK